MLPRCTNAVCQDVPNHGKAKRHSAGPARITTFGYPHAFPERDRHLDYS